jgi:hypothetical protein
MSRNFCREKLTYLLDELCRFLDRVDISRQHTFSISYDALKWFKFVAKKEDTFYRYIITNKISTQLFMSLCSSAMSRKKRQIYSIFHQSSNKKQKK